MSSKRKVEFIRTVKYTGITLSAGVIQMSTVVFFEELTTLRYWATYLIALFLSIIWNFYLNRKYTFKSNNNATKALYQVFAYYAVFTPISTFGGDYFVETLRWNPYVVTSIIMVTNGLTEFLFQRLYVYRHSINSRIDAKNTEIDNEATDSSKVIIP